MCQVWASIIPAPWWVIKHIWSIPAFPISPGICAHSQLPGLICHLHLFLKINLSHICGQETARPSATSIWAQWFEHYQKGRVKNGTIWIACELPHHVLLLVFVTGRQALKQWFFFLQRKCYPGDSSFTPEMIGSVSHVSCVWHVSLSCPPVNGKLQQINSIGTQRQFSLTVTFSPSSLKFKRFNI